LSSQCSNIIRPSNPPPQDAGGQNH
jgi:hypothetical protein